MNYKASEDLWKMGSKKSKIEKPFIKSKDFALST